MSLDLRVGIGYDSHRLVDGRRLILGGVEIPFEKGLSGHSDGDILFHALTDALLGAMGLGDIGQYFPPSDPQWKDADSAIFLARTRRLLEDNGYRIVNVDTVIAWSARKSGPYYNVIRKESPTCWESRWDEWALRGRRPKAWVR